MDGTPVSGSQPLSVAERQELGRAARSRVPRSSLGGYAESPDRPDPVALITGQAASRIPELVPIRHGRMLQSPFAFFRGAALIMASDLSRQPNTELTTQLCGDAHLANFGLFGTPERRLVFDINDFDETHPGPWEWDVKRLTASLIVAARDRGFTAKDAHRIALRASRSYRRTMAALAEKSNLEVWYARLDAAEMLQNLEKSPQAERVNVTRVKGTIDKALTHDSMQAVSKLTEVVNGRRRFISQPPLLTPMREILNDPQALQDLIANYRTLIETYQSSLLVDRRHLLSTYTFTALAQKVVGVGSVGTRCWVALLIGRDDADPLLLQIKEAQASVLERFTSPSIYPHQGERVVAGQRLMQSATDAFLGWETFSGVDGLTSDYYIRQLRDWKGSVTLDSMAPPGFELYADVCGTTLARAHARAGDRIAIAAYLGQSDTFDRAMTDFAEAYADQNDRDFAAFEEAVHSGRIEARTGV